MANAELTAVSSYISLETCGHFMCTCKLTLDDDPAQVLIDVQTVVTERKISTSLLITDEAGREKELEVNGVRRPDVVKEAFNGCEGPEITSAGVVCGGICRLERA